MILASDRRALPLAIVYLPVRQEPGDGLAFSGLENADPRLFLASSFLPYLAGRARLRRHLETWADVLDQAAAFRIDVPAALGPTATAAALLEHALLQLAPETDAGHLRAGSASGESARPLPAR